MPYGPDAFYHARRILTLLDTGVLLQFDPDVNAPYGDLISWPWAYDSLMALLLHMLRYVFIDADRIELPVKIPPAYAYINAALIIAVSLALRLRLFYIIMAVFCYAVSPLTQGIHMIGNIDHHMVEYSFVLATLVCGLLYLRQDESKMMALLLGVVLGAATAFHNG